MTHLLRVILQFQTISSFFALSLKRMVKNIKSITLGKELEDGSGQVHSSLNTDPTSTVSLGDEEG